MTAREADAALQMWLAGEHAAIYAYGVVGGRLPEPLQGFAVRDRDAHRARRDSLQDQLSRRREVPVAAAPAYDLPVPVQTPADAFQLAIGVEERISRASFAVVAAADSGDIRRLAAGALQEQAVRAAGWRRLAGVAPTTTAFPGRP